MNKEKVFNPSKVISALGFFIIISGVIFIANRDKPIKQEVKLNKVAKIENTKDTTLFNSAENSYNIREYAAAAKILDKIIQKDPFSQKSYVLLIRSLLADNKPDVALKKIKYLFTKGVSDPELNKIRAQILLDQGKISDAVLDLEVLAASGIEDIGVLSLLANAYLQQENYLKANKIYKFLTETYPKNGDFWMGYAVSSEEIEKLADARDAYNKVLESGNVRTSVLEYAEERERALG